MAELETLEIETGPNPQAAVVWMHGLGADAHDFEPVIPILDFGPQRPIRYVFPNAPVRPVTLNGGMAMRAWYDIFSLDRAGPVDEAGINDSSTILEVLVEREIERGIDPGQIVIAGFSQGGAIAINTILRSSRKYAGLLALSAWLPLPAAIEEHGADTSLPVFMAHGQFDPMIPMQYGRLSADRLIEAGFEVEWHDYPMAHAVCPDEIADLRQWLVSVYAA